MTNEITNMSFCENKMLFDDWTVTTKEEDAFRGVLDSITQNSQWQHGVQTCKMRVLPMNCTALEAEATAEKYGIDLPLVEDTISHTQLMLEIEGVYYPLRTSAIKSMLETAKISGNALSKIPKEQLAEILNYCLDVAQGKTLLLSRAGKATAVLSADARGYGILPFDELFDITKKTIQHKFGSGVLAEGSVNHEFMKAFFKLPQSNRALEEYKDFTESVYDLSEIAPGVILKSSDVGMCAATLEPIFIHKNKYWKIGNADKLHHKPGNTMEDFQSLSEGIFSKLDKTIEKFAELSKVRIYHPYNAFMLACKKAKLPKKYATEALEEFSMMVAEDELTNAHDIYLGITEILFYAKRDGMDNINVSYLEDNISKILNFHWNELDLAGTHAW